MGANTLREGRRCATAAAGDANCRAVQARRPAPPRLAIPARLRPITRPVSASPSWRTCLCPLSWPASVSPSWPASARHLLCFRPFSGPPPGLTIPVQALHTPAPLPQAMPTPPQAEAGSACGGGNDIRRARSQQPPCDERLCSKVCTSSVS